MLTDAEIDAICGPGRAARWHGDGRQYDRDTARLIEAALATAPKEGSAGAAPAAQPVAWIEPERLLEMTTNKIGAIAYRCWLSVCQPDHFAGRTTPLYATPPAGAAPVDEKQWAQKMGAIELADPDPWPTVGAAPVGEALNWPALMPTYGEVRWSDLKAAVAEATGAPWSEDPSYYIGHQPAPINMNSLNRIVSAFVRAALAPGDGK